MTTVRNTVCVVILAVLQAPAALSEHSSTLVRVASISFEPIKLDLAGNTQKLEQWFRRAAKGGAEIAVAPEGALDGYIVNEILAGEFKPDQMREVAVGIESTTIRRFQDLARELEMCLVFGFAELVGQDVFNTAVFIDQTGVVRGKYHKMQFHEGYDPDWWFNRLGKQSRAFDTPYGRCGILICNDRWNPLLAKIPALDGAQFLVIPSFGSTSTAQDEAVLARATENGVPVIEANVGVSLIASDDRIVSISRERAGITFGEIRIPANGRIDSVARDRVQAEFLAWREQEMPRRRAKYMAALDPRGPARDKDTVELGTSELRVLIGNNRSLERDGVTHRAGYNGLFSLRSTSETESPFVPSYAGWNLEHYFDARPRSASEVFFEPRFAEMSVRKLADDTVELYQPVTPVFQVESWTRFSVVEPNAIDVSFRCKPHRDDYAGDFLGVFWASYINGPIDKSLYFLDSEATLQKPLWRQLCSQTHNRDSTVAHASDTTKLAFEGNDTLFANVSPLRYSAPFFYGRFRDMVLIYAFRPGPNIRFAHSPSGGGLNSTGTDTNPAWDFQLVVPQPVKGHEYTLAGRLVYKRWKGREDVLAEISKFLASPTSSVNAEPSR